MVARRPGMDLTGTRRFPPSVRGRRGILTQNKKEEKVCVSARKKRAGCPALR